MGDSSEERRRAERVDVNFEFGGQHEGGAGAPTFVANVSELGVFVQTTQLMPLGTEVNLRFTLLLDDPVLVEGKGRVVRHQAKPSGMGFEFIDVGPGMEEKLAAAIERNRPFESGPPISARDASSDLAVDDDDSARTVIDGAALVEVREHVAEPPEDEEKAQTLVKLRAVDVEIIEDDDLPVDDGGDIG